jgi:casein kinase 1
MATHNQHQQQQALSAGSSHNVVGVHYRVGKKIGEGWNDKLTFHLDSQINQLTNDTFLFTFHLSGTNLLNNQQVAIKFEPRKSDAPQLRDEYRTYKVMAGTPGIPKAYFFGKISLSNPCISTHSLTHRPFSP